MFASSASIATLKKRAELLTQVRAFFYGKAVMEVDVPLLSSSSVTDVNLEALHCQVSGRTAYLQTSPEFYMKRLLAMGSGDIFYLGKAFRQDESGRQHRPEFTLLEWYRAGFDQNSLSAEVVELIISLAPATPVTRSSYGELFQQHLGINPYRATTEVLAALAKQKVNASWEDADASTWLDLLFTHCIEPNMPKGLLVVTDFPQCQAALARIGRNGSGDLIAHRFEVYWDGLELANGYWELTSEVEQRARFAADCAARNRQGKLIPPLDEKLLAALAAGVPDCAGVALGIDRLLMKWLAATQISEVMPFADG